MDEKPSYEALVKRNQELENELSGCKQYKESLREVEAIIEMTERISHVGTWRLNLATNKISWSDELYHIFGLQKQKSNDLLQKAVELIHPDDRAYAVEISESSIAAKKPYRTEYRIVRPDNTVRHAITIAEIVYGDKEEVEEFIGIVQDITDHKRAEERLNASEKISRAWLEHSPVCTKIVDLDFNLQYMSAAGISDLNIDDITRFYGKPYPFDFYPESFRNIMTMNLEKVKETGKIIEQEGSVVDINGNELWFHSTIVPVNDDDGRIDYIIVVSTDITERRQAREALIDSQKRFRTIFDQAPVGIAIGDSKTNQFLHINDAFCNIFGYQKSELLDIDFMQITHPEDVQKSLANMERLRAGASPHYRIDKRYVRKDKTVVWASTTVAPLWEGNTESQNFMAIVENITERKNAEEEKKRLEAQLRQTQKMEAIGTLAGGIAHDFNNILSAVLGYTELLQKKLPKDSEEFEFNEQVYKAGNRARDLVQQILTFSRQTEHELKPVEVDILIKEVTKLLRLSLSTTIEIKYNIQSNPLVMGDPTQLHQILMNLCTNAGHAMHERGGVLTIDLKTIELNENLLSPQVMLTPGVYVQLSVSDTGHGIPAKIIDRVFDPSFTTKKRDEGTGMGLSVIHGIVESYKGATYVYSEEGKGTTFKIFLPAIERRDKPDKREAGDIPKGNEHILFIDDEPVLVEMSTSQLEPLGYKVSSRSSSLEALELFKNNPDKFDLVITDLTMPKMTGDKLAKEIKSISPDTPVILCSGFSSKITPDNMQQYHIDSFLMKPIIIRDMAKVVREVLDRQ